MNLNPQNILIIDFGQLGDVVLSLPAVKAIRQKFPDSRITVAVGKSCAPVIDLSGCANEKFVVNRVELRDSAKLWSIVQIGKIIKDIRARNFDLVIDLHSLPETNILGFLSGAKHRLYANRENRSLDFLSNFSSPTEDKTKHVTDRYLEALKPLGIENAERRARLSPPAKDLETIEELWQKRGLKGLTIGLFPGAGHPSRRWKLENFAALADFLERNDNLNIAVFLGPEEKNLAGEVKNIFPPDAQIFDNLNLTELIAALAKLSVFVSNDTGPMHLAAAVGTPIVLLLDERAPRTYLPLAENLRVLQSGKIDEIEVETTYEATREMLVSNRVQSLRF